MCSGVFFSAQDEEEIKGMAATKRVELTAVWHLTKKKNELGGVENMVSFQIAKMVNMRPVVGERAKRAGEVGLVTVTNLVIPKQEIKRKKVKKNMGMVLIQKTL